MRYIKLFEQFVEELNESLNKATASKLIKASLNKRFYVGGDMGNNVDAQQAFRAATGASKLPNEHSVNFEGQSIMVGGKALATWKEGMTVGQVFQVYAKVVDAAAKAALEDKITMIVVRFKGNEEEFTIEDLLSYKDKDSNLQDLIDNAIGEMGYDQDDYENYRIIATNKGKVKPADRDSIYSEVAKAANIKEF